ncbi:MAG: hypothetical protein AAFQ94_29450, partial [Bacteroidota bacterium]
PNKLGREISIFPMRLKREIFKFPERYKLEVFVFSEKPKREIFVFSVKLKSDILVFMEEYKPEIFIFPEKPKREIFVFSVKLNRKVFIFPEKSKQESSSFLKEQLCIQGDPRLKSISISCQSLNYVKLEGGKVVEQFRISNTIVDSFVLDGVRKSFSGKMYLREPGIRFLIFSNYTGSDLVQISSLKKHEDLGYLEFTNSSFKELELIGNRFDQFDFIVFKNSNIRNAFVAETVFPKHVQMPYPLKEPDERYVKKEESVLQKKLLSEQLKVIHRNQGNYTTALRYQANELNMHYKQLNWQGDFRDKATLFFHKYTTNFGQDWIRGSAILLVVSWILYSVLLLSTEKVNLGQKVSGSEWNGFVMNFFEFINPTNSLLRRWDYIYELEGIKPGETEKQLCWYIAALLYFSKFIIITLTYQIIQAFRKFGKG